MLKEASFDISTTNSAVVIVFLRRFIAKSLTLLRSFEYLRVTLINVFHSSTLFSS